MTLHGSRLHWHAEDSKDLILKVELLCKIFMEFNIDNSKIVKAMTRKIMQQTSLKLSENMRQKSSVLMKKIVIVNHNSLRCKYINNLIETKILPIVQYSNLNVL